MRRRGGDSRGAIAVVCAALALTAGRRVVRAEGASPAVAPSPADGGASGVGIVAEAACDPLPGPGKVQCIVRVRAVRGSLRWSDAIVLSAPPFAPPLRTRVAAGDAKRSDAEGVEFSLALAATGDGDGELHVLARATVCGDGGCRPVRAEAVARVVVGAIGNLAQGGDYR
jgi:hypothetical protein